MWTFRLKYYNLLQRFIAEEGYSILTETSTQSFLVSDNTFLFLIIIMPDYNYSIFKWYLLLGAIVWSPLGV